MTKNELIAVLRLQNVPNIGDVTAKKLISHCGSPAAVFKDKAYQLQKIDGIGTLTIKGLFDTAHLAAAEAEYDNYLKHCIDGPMLLFKRGNIDLDGRKIISIVGTRKITSYGTALCEELVAELAPLNPIIVSGFAYGVDICAQREKIS